MRGDLGPVGALPVSGSGWISRKALRRTADGSLALDGEAAAILLDDDEHDLRVERHPGGFHCDRGRCAGEPVADAPAGWAGLPAVDVTRTQPSPEAPATAE